LALAAVMTETKKATYRELEADLEIRRCELVADGVVALTLAHPDGKELPEWTPGAHIDLVLSESLVRQYSLCSSTSVRGEWRVGILRDPNSRGGSKFVHDELKEGSKLRVRGPRNHFPLLSSPRYQFIAGGIGITPILTMIESAEARGADWNLLYGGRERASMGFLNELERYGDRVTVCPQDEKGILDLPSVLGTPQPDTLVYCCGPEVLLDAVEGACGHWPEGSLHIERFAPKKQTGEPSPEALETFEVVCQRSGVTFTIPAEDSIYDILAEADIDVIASCMEGVCGTCEVEVIEGVPDHRDSILSEADGASGETIMICVSRSRSERLVLDI
jgi:ferredoxin-NADP reductase